MLQAIINILTIQGTYVLVALSFSLIYNTNKFFNLIHASYISLGGYFLFFLSKQIGLPVYLSIPISLICVITISLLIEKFIFSKLNKRTSNTYILLTVSIGLYVIFESIILLFWGANSKSIRFSQIIVGNPILDAYITNTQIVIIFTSVMAFIATLSFIKHSNIGLQIKAFSNNSYLSSIMGVNSKKVLIVSISIGTGIGAIAGILVGMDKGITPAYGFNLLLYGIVAMIIGGVNSFSGILLGSLILSIFQYLAAYYIDNKWMDAIAYLILILFLVFKPLGFSGKQLKKVEI